MSKPSGSIRLFGVRGIDVYLHWTWWLLVALLVVLNPSGRSRALEFLLLVSMFAIVLLHELGHAIVCRSVGGRSSHIVLWPVGGAAFVEPPAQPMAVFWSIAAGPLVNLLLVPITFGIASTMIPADHMLAAVRGNGQLGTWSFFFLILAVMNLGVLIFNLAPVYPLDGGQIVRAVLWRFIGHRASLYWVAVISLTFAVVCMAAASFAGNRGIWILALFLAYRAYSGFRLALNQLQPAASGSAPDRD